MPSVCNRGLVFSNVLFSYTHKTRDLSEGLIYRPTISLNFSIKCLSRLSLKVLTKCGFRLCCFHIRRIVASLRACALVIVRVLQCVALGDVVYRVASVTALIFRADVFGIWPGRGASFYNSART